MKIICTGICMNLQNNCKQMEYHLHMQVRCMIDAFTGVKRGTITIDSLLKQNNR